MRILFTTASSFIGYRLVRKLVAAGHEVVAACRSDARCEGLRTKQVHREAANTPRPYRLRFGTQTEFPEPRVRINTISSMRRHWDGAKRRPGTSSLDFLGATNVF